MHVEAGGDEHPHVVETLRAVVEQASATDLSLYAQDAVIAETVRGLVEGLDELDNRTEALLREALGTPPLDRPEPEACTGARDCPGPHIDGCFGQTWPETGPFAQAGPEVGP